MPKDRSIILAGTEYPIRYYLHERAYAEAQLKESLVSAIQSGTVEGTVAVLWAGIHRSQCTSEWKGRGQIHARCEFTLDDMFELLELHREGGGEYSDAVKQALRTLFEGGMLGKNIDAKTLGRILGEEESGKERPAVPAQ